MSGKYIRYSKFFAVALVATVLLAACGTAIQPDLDADRAGTAGTDIASDFQIDVYHGGEVVDGQTINFSELLEKDTPVVLNLWAGLCPPCRLEMPEFEQVSEEFGDEILLIGLDVGPFTNLGTSEDGQALVQELGITYPTGTTTDARVVKDYQVLGMPTTFFIKPDGEIVRKWTGLLTEDKLAELVEELMNLSTGS